MQISQSPSNLLSQFQCHQAFIQFGYIYKKNVIFKERPPKKKSNTVKVIFRCLYATIGRQNCI